MAVWDLNSNLDVFGMQTFLVYLLIQLNVSITSVNDMTSAKKMSEKKKNN